MSTTPEEATGWPFWAPSNLTSVERALDLAGVVAGEVVADLGCGDGQVLVAAGRRGATVIGVECDADLAEQARRALAANDLDGEVLEADLFDLDLAADVYFSYLAPATLQRLLPQLRTRHGARFVTIDFAVPGLLTDAQDDLVHLYRLPGRRRRLTKQPGWSNAGALVIAVPDCQSLTVLDLHHPGGDVEIAISGQLRDAVAVLTGTDVAREREHVAVDLRWEPHDEGTLLRGSLDVRGVRPYPVTVLFASDEEGCWELTDEGVANVVSRLARRPKPSKGADLVAAAMGE